MIDLIIFNEDISLGIILLSISIPLFLLTLWCYIQTTKTDPGYPPFVYDSIGGKIDTNINLENFQLPFHGYCDICEFPKVLRCRHCTKCGKCQLKMDHHCPWMLNCIGFYNQKFFFLFLCYCLLLLLLAGLTLLIYSSIQLHDDIGTIPKSIIRVVFGAIYAILSIVLFSLLVVHIYLISINQTTIEAIQSNSFPCLSKSSFFPSPYPSDIFTVGLKNNWIQVSNYN